MFIRKGNRLELTDEGQAFYFEVAKVFDAVAGLDDAAASIRAKRYGSLNLAAMPLLSNTFLPRVSARFLAKSSRLKMAFKTYRSEEVARRVQSQAIDLGFAFVDTEFAGVRAQKVRCECVCLLPASSPLARRNVIDAIDLADQILIRHEKDELQRRLDKTLRRYGIACREQIEVSLASTAAALVREGAGIAITDPFTAYMASELSDVVVRPTVMSLPFEFDILYPALRPENQSAMRFVELFLQQAREMDIELHIGPVRDLCESA